VNFWLYMFLTTLLIPAVMLFLGYRFKNGGPKKINHFFGYRTSRSMKNRDTWDFAHRRCGAYWSWLGWPFLSAALLYMPTLRRAGDEIISLAATILVLIQLLVMCLVVIPTERALKRTFDEKGNRIG